MLCGFCLCHDIVVVGAVSLCAAYEVFDDSVVQQVDQGQYVDEYAQYGDYNTAQADEYYVQADGYGDESAAASTTYLQDYTTRDAQWFMAGGGGENAMQGDGDPSAQGYAYEAPDQEEKVAGDPYAVASPTAMPSPGAGGYDSVATAPVAASVGAQGGYNSGTQTTSVAASGELGGGY